MVPGRNSHLWSRPQSQSESIWLGPLPNSDVTTALVGSSWQAGRCCSILSNTIDNLSFPTVHTTSSGTMEARRQGETVQRTPNLTSLCPSTKGWCVFHNRILTILLWRFLLTNSPVLEESLLTHSMYLCSNCFKNIFKIRFCMSFSYIFILVNLHQPLFCSVL